MRALVTGGAGFIGSHLSRRLIKEGWGVHIVDNLSTGFESNVPEDAEFTLLDISKYDFIKYLPKDKFDAVFHLAAQSSGEASFDDPIYDLMTNCTSTLMLLEWCFRNKIGSFIYASSMSVYGEQKKQPVKEDSFCNPNSFYGVGKLASEGYINIYAKMGLNTTILRLFNVYGPNQNMDNLRQGMVSIYMAYIANDEEILVKGSKNRFRDLIYIDDVIDIFIKCINNRATYGKCYNVATGKKTFVHELLDAELKTFGYEPGKYPVRFEGSTPGDIMGIVADIAAINEATGWKPRIPLPLGLKKMREWLILSKSEAAKGEGA